MSQAHPVRLFVTGATGVMGQALLQLAAAAGYHVDAPGHDELDLFDAGAVRDAVSEADAILHLATRIPPLERVRDPEAWRETNRLRSEASRALVDGALAGRVDAYVQPTVPFLHSAGGGNYPWTGSALEAESQAGRFTAAGRRGVVLRLGLLWGPGTGQERPNLTFGAALHVEDAARALLAAVDAPGGTYVLASAGERASITAFHEATGWSPRH